LPEKTLRDLAKPTIDLFNQYQGGDRRQWEEQVAEDIEFVNNVQWDSAEVAYLEGQDKPALAINEMKIARERVVGQLTKNSPGWIAVPTEDSDVKVAGDASALLRWIWDGSKGNMHNRASTEAFEDTGLYALMAYIDPFADLGKGEIRICHVNPAKIYFDPRCTYRNASDSSNIFVADVYSESRILNDYPDFDFTDTQEYKSSIQTFGTREIQQGQVFNPKFLNDEKYYRVIDRYQKIKVNRVRVYDSQSNFEKVLTEKELAEFRAKPAVIMTKIGQEKYLFDESDVQQALFMIRTYGNVFHVMSDGSMMSGVEGDTEMLPDGQMIYSVPNSTVRMFVVSMGEMLDKGYLNQKIVKVDRVKRSLVIGEKLYSEHVLPISRYPFGITMLHHTGTPYCYGDARLAKPIQEQINKVHSLIVSYNTNITNVKLLIQKGSAKKQDIEEQWGKAGTAVIEVDMTEAIPIVLQLQSMSNAFYDQLDRLTNLIQKIYGAYDFQDGMISNPPQTRGGTLAMFEAGMDRAITKLQLIEEALNDLGAVAGEMIPYVYDRRKVIRIITPNNKTKNIVFNDTTQENGETKIINDLTVNKYDYKVISGSTLPSNRWAKFEAYMNLWEKQVIRNPEPLIRASDFPDVEEILENEDRLREAEQIISQMDETIKDLSGDMQTLQRENVHANQQVVVEKFKTKLEKIAARMEQSQLLTQYRLNDLVKTENKKKEVSTKK
jgi:hypothetical protein